jgi:pyridoxamine 5'-phosphate oxidase
VSVPEGAPIPCPENWGAIRITPDLIEFWTEETDRLHDRLAYQADDVNGWICSRLAP